MTALIVTLRLDHAAQTFFDALRTAHFPPHRLVVGAHVTMFHAIPGELETALVRQVQAACESTTVFPIGIARLRFLGRGVAYDLASPASLSVRSGLATHFAGSLTPQDGNAWSPHVTVQNKVTPAQARATHDMLRGVAVPHPILAVGIGVWRYLGGPWAPVASFGFRESGSASDR